MTRHSLRLLLAIAWLAAACGGSDERSAAQQEPKISLPPDQADAETLGREVLELVSSGHFSRGDKEMFRPLVDNLLQSDPFLVLADFDDYAACQAKVDTAWTDAARWTRMSMMNTACAGKFSSDRAIGEYCDRIWNAKPVPVSVDR